MNKKEQRLLIIAAVVIAVILFLLFGRNKIAQQIITKSGDSEEIEIPGLTIPDLFTDVPPIGYTPSPWEPVVYQGGMQMPNFGRDDCRLCMQAPAQEALPIAPPREVAVATPAPVLQAAVYSPRAMSSGYSPPAPRPYWESGSSAGRLF